MTTEAAFVYGDIAQLVLWIDALSDIEKRDIAHKLHEIWEKKPEHKDWMLKLHELLDLQ